MKEYSVKTIEKNKQRAFDARNREIAEVIEGMETLVKDGYSRKFNAQRYKIKDTKISIVGSFFVDNETAHKGNSIDFMAYRYGMDFKTAVDFLTNEEDYQDLKEGFSVPEKKERKIDNKEINLERLEKEIGEFKFPEQDMVKNKHNIMFYLVSKRRLDLKIVQWLVDKRLIRQDNRGNAVFVWKDHKGRAVGADIKGTSGIVMESTGREFLSVMSGSVNGFGFNVKKGKPSKVYFFEAPIDLISYLQLHKGQEKLNNALFVALGGLKESVVRTFLQLYPEVKDNITFCLDNDSKAEAFINRNFEDLVYKREKSMTKDWNEDLKYK